MDTRVNCSCCYSRWVAGSCTAQTEECWCLQHPPHADRDGMKDRGDESEEEVEGEMCRTRVNVGLTVGESLVK